MSTIHVRGLHKVNGEIGIQGSKNAVLPMMAASVLHKGTTVLTHVPRIQDVFCMMGILEYMGCSCTMEGHRLTICTDSLKDIRIPREYITAMRSSIMMLGALLGRCGEAATYYPGGCSIGKRPIDLHLYALRQLGVEIEEEREAEDGAQNGMILARCRKLKGGAIHFSFPSVGATENALLAAVLAEGTTVITGAAREPEISQLCQMLNSMGARITGGGTSRIVIEGVEHFHDTVYDVPGDRIVAGTYLSCVMAAGGEAVFHRVCPQHLPGVLNILEDMGAHIRTGNDWIAISMEGRPLPVSLQTAPYPGFPTDLQSPMIALLSVSQGTGRVQENIFEGRFATARELRKMGAHIIIEDTAAIVTGTYPLRGSRVKAMDLRGGAALVVAGLAAEGETVIEDCHHILRGYEDICQDLNDLGARLYKEERTYE